MQKNEKAHTTLIQTMLCPFFSAQINSKQITLFVPFVKLFLSSCFLQKTILLNNPSAIKYHSAVLLQMAVECIITQNMPQNALKALPSLDI